MCTDTCKGFNENHHGDFVLLLLKQSTTLSNVQLLALEAQRLEAEANMLCNAV